MSKITLEKDFENRVIKVTTDHGDHTDHASTHEATTNLDAVRDVLDFLGNFPERSRIETDDDWGNEVVGDFEGIPVVRTNDVRADETIRGFAPRWTTDDPVGIGTTAPDRLMDVLPTVELDRREPIRDDAGWVTLRTENGVVTEERIIDGRAEMRTRPIEDRDVRWVTDEVGDTGTVAA